MKPTITSQVDALEHYADDIYSILEYLMSNIRHRLDKGTLTLPEDLLDSFEVREKMLKQVNANFEKRRRCTH